MDKGERRARFQAFLLGFFSNKPENEHLDLNGFVLFKHWDGAKNCWRVDLFTKDSFAKLQIVTVQKLI